MTVRWTPPAFDDLESLHAYISADNPSTADGTVDQVLAGIEALGRSPEMGRPGRVAGTREFVVPPFVIAYKVRRGAVEIVAIIHGARRWPESF